MPLDGLVNRTLAGKTVEVCYKDGHFLIIRTKCSHEFKIGWTDSDSVAPIRGEPFLHSVGVRIILPAPSGTGVSEAF